MSEENLMCSICGGLHPAGHRDKKMSEEYIEIVEKATKQLQYDILCLGDEEILVLNRLVHGYLMSQGVFSESEKMEKEA